MKIRHARACFARVKRALSVPSGAGRRCLYKTAFEFGFVEAARILGGQFFPIAIQVVELATERNQILARVWVIPLS